MTQTRHSLIVVTLFSALALAVGPRVLGSVLEERQAPPAAANPLIGTWRQIRGSFNGKPFVVPEGRTIIKMHTAKNYVFIDANSDGSLVDLVGGTYTLAGNRYETMPTLGFGGAFERVKGKAQLFEARIDGNTWYHKGTLSGGLTIDEEWRRVD